MQTKTPIQYSNSKIIIKLKSFLHTKIGAKIGFALGLKGFNRVGAVLTRANPKWYQSKQEFLGFAYNSRVNKGADLIASLITGAAQNSISAPLPPKYIALSTATLTPDKTDTTLASETAATGLARALGVQGSYTGPSALDGAASYTVTKTFTNSSGGAVTIVSAALFDAAASGNLFVEANLSSSAVMAALDTLAITWSVNL
jgi:hypothetical protein